MKKLKIVVMIMALMLFLVSAVSADTVFTDDFESGLTAWTPTKEGNSDIFNAETTAHEAYVGSGAAFMYGDTSDYKTVAIEKELVLTDYKNVEIEFYWAVESFDDSSEEAIFEVSTDGTTWTTIDTLFTGPSTDTSDHTTTPLDYTQEINVDLSAYDGQSSLIIRFAAELKTGDQSTPGDLFIIDDVTVTGDLIGTPPTVSGIPDVTMNEDTPDSSIDLDDYITELDGDTITWGYSGNTNIAVSIDGSNVVTLTPVANWYGSETITFTATDKDGSDFDDILVTVDSVNDAPVVDVSDCETSAIEDEPYTCTITADDEEGNDLEFSLVTDKFPEGMTIDSLTGVITWKPDEDQIGNNNVIVAVVDDGTPTPASNTKPFTVFVRPDDVCGIGTEESGLKITVDITDYDEDFYPGDKIEIEVEVENKKSDEEIENIIVEAILYDVDDGKDIDTVKIDDFDLDEKEDEIVELILEIPKDIDTSHKFIVFISASGDGDDDEYCDWGYNDNNKDDLEIKRRNHDIAIEKVLVTPSTVKAGKTVEVRVDVENVGARDEENVYVKVKNGDLGIDKKSELFEVEEYEKGDDDEYSVTITFTVPEDTAEGNYDLEIYVYDDDDEVYESGTKFVTFYVEGTGTPSTPGTTPTGTVTVSTEGTQEEVEKGVAFNIPVKITNTADETKEYKITISNIGDWAKSTSEFDVYLTAGQTSTYYITVTPNEDAAEGKHSATINVKEGTAIVATKTLSFTIPGTSVSGITGGTVLDVEPEEGTGFFNNLFSGTTLWIIGDLVLVVVAIFFIRMLFSKKS